MTLTITDILRRGLDNTLANWQVIVIRILTVIVLIAITVIVIAVAIVPLVVGIGISFNDPEVLAASIAGALAKAWLIVLYVAGILTFVLFVTMLLYSFAEAGCARVYIDGERAAGPAMTGVRARFRVFSMERWWDAAKDGGWTIFWIYNIVWGVAGLVLLVPLLPTLAGLLIFREQPQVAACFGCFGLAATFLLMIPVFVISGLWTAKAIVVAMARDCGAKDAIRTGWREVKLDFMRHLIVAIALLAISFVGSSIISAISGGLSVGSTLSRSTALTFAFMPLRIALFMISSAFSAAIGGWMLASFAALTEAVGRLPLVVDSGTTQQ